METVNIYVVSKKVESNYRYHAFVITDKFSYSVGSRQFDNILDELAKVLGKVFYRDKFELELHISEKTLLNSIEKRFIGKKIDVSENEKDKYGQFMMMYNSFKSVNTHLLSKNDTNYKRLIRKLN